MVIIGFLGTLLDDGSNNVRRWLKWRPTVRLCQHEDLLINRFELLINEKHQSLAEVIAQDIKQVSPETTVKFHYINLKDPWDFEEVYGALHDFSMEYKFDLENEEYFLHLTTGTHVAQICMFLLTESRYFPAKLIQSSPSSKENSSPGKYKIIDLDLSKYDRIAQRFHSEQVKATSFLKSGISTRNPAFNDMIDQIERVVIKTKSPILLIGPTGSGKSKLARRIYELKKLRHQVTGAFIEVNCATLKGEGAMSALFGHRKGTYSGSTTDRLGLLSSANKSILFLDEISELGLNEQAMILRAIEEKSFLPLGSDKEVVSDFQLLVGANKYLAEEVEKGTFREDLFARLNLWTYYLPSLKERKEDIEPNIEYELQKFSQENAQNITFNKEAREKYLDFCLSSEAHWSANFRDLSASIHRMSTLAEGGRIKISDVSNEILRLKELWHFSSKGHSTKTLEIILQPEEIQEIDIFDKIQLAGVIDVCKSENSISSAGRKLFSTTRTKKKTSNDADRLSKYLARFGLNWKQIKEVLESKGKSN